MDGLGVLVGILVLCWFLPGRCAAAGSRAARLQRVAIGRIPQKTGADRRAAHGDVGRRTHCPDSGSYRIPVRRLRRLLYGRQRTATRLGRSMTRFECGAAIAQRFIPGASLRENRTLRLLNPMGDEVEYPFYEDGSGRRYFFRARAWWCARVLSCGPCAGSRCSCTS